MAEYVDDYVKERCDEINKLLEEIGSYYTRSVRSDLQRITSGDVYMAMDYDNLLDIITSGVTQIGKLKGRVETAENSIRNVGRFGESLEMKVNSLVGKKRA